MQLGLFVCTPSHAAGTNKQKTSHQVHGILVAVCGGVDSGRNGPNLGGEIGLLPLHPGRPFRLPDAFRYSGS